jgi:hypothetical protein
MPVNHSTPKPLQVAAAVIGNALEWYDFIIFGFLTVVIARLFFPAESQYASLLLTTATFGVGFFMRPVGGILLGLYADHKGRKAALLLIIVLMTAAIAMIGFAPTYAAIGVAAPLIMVLARLLRGFCHRWRVRECNKLPNRKCSGASARFLRLLADGRPGLGCAYQCTFGGAHHAQPHSGGARQLGLAGPVSAWARHRSGWALHSPSSSRNRGVP